MSEATSKSKPRRRWLQFSMRSVLLLTVVAALLSAWFIAPEERFRDFGRRGAKIREEFVRQIDPNTKQGVPVLDGRWQLFDEHGLVRVEGHISRELPSGRWTVLDADGNPLIDGTARDGHRVGDWKAWYSSQQMRSLAHYEPADSANARTSGGVNAPRQAATSSIRTGEVKAWWPNGKPRVEGQFAPHRDSADAPITSEAQRSGSRGLPFMTGQSPKQPPLPPLELAEGAWTTFDEHGQQIAHGNYLDGLRDGPWQFRSSDGAEKTVNYVAGEPVDALDAKIARLTEQLEAPTFRERHRAMWQLIQLGDAIRPKLLAWLDGDNLERKRMAAGALGQIGNNDGAILTLLAALAADETTPRDLRESVLKSLQRAPIESASAAAKLQRLSSADEPDLELRRQARLTRVTLDPSSFDKIGKELLIEFAGVDDRASYVAIDTLRQVFAATGKPDCANSLRGLNRSERMAVAVALTRYFDRHGRWGEHWPVAGNLVELLQEDQDFAIRELAAKLRMPNDEDLQVGGFSAGGSPNQGYGFPYPSYRGEGAF